MATIPGSVFDSSTNLNITPVQGHLIDEFLTRLTLDQNTLTDTIVGTGGSQAFSSDVIIGGLSGSTSAAVLGDGGSVQVAGGTGSGITGSITVGNTTGSSSEPSGPGGMTAAGQFVKPGGNALTDGGPTISDNQAAFLDDIALKNNADVVTMASIDKALQLLSENGEGAPADLVTGYLRFSIPDGVTKEVTVDTSSVTDDVLFIARLLDMTSDSTLVLTGMEKVILVGAGNARIDGSDAAMVVGDTTDQNIAGGAGADTLVGGGGNDTLTGGAGDDVFGFINKGHYTITDFDQGADMLAFQVDGVNNLDQLKNFVSSVDHADGNTTINFGANASITLVGVDVDALTSDMVKFTIS